MTRCSGDMAEGNGDASLCTFGEQYTPNQHKLAREFVLLDNTYCAGMCSADGHQWTDSALANEYVERQLTSGSPRSYPGGQEAGTPWMPWLGRPRGSSGTTPSPTAAPSATTANGWSRKPAGRTGSARTSSPGATSGKTSRRGAGATQLRSRAASGGCGQCSNTNTVGWDLKVPDVLRAAEFIRDLRQFETNGGFPDFVLLFLPNDHTGRHARAITPRRARR